MLGEKISATAVLGGSGTAVVSASAEYLGLTPGEWQIVGIVGGLAIGLLGLIVNAAINAYFSWKRLQIDIERAKEK